MISYRAAVAGGVGALLLSALLANSLLANPLFTALGLQTSWFGVAAVLTCSFAGAACLSRKGSHLTRLFGFFFLAMAVYTLDITVTYDSRRLPIEILDRLQMAASPFVFVLWIRIALELVSQTARVPHPRRSTRGRSLLTTQSLKLGFVRVAATPVEVVLVWLPALAFIVLGAGFGLDYTEKERVGELWLGYWGWDTQPLYWVQSTWGAAVIVTGAVLILRARGSDGSVQLPGVGEVLRWAPWFMASMSVMAIALIFGTTAKIWPESFLDAFVALLVLGFALLVMDADAYRDAAAAFSSLRQRAAGSAGLLAVLFGIVAVTAGGIARHAVLAAALGAGFPLTVRATDWLRGSRPHMRPGSPTDERAAAALAALLADPGGVDMPLPDTALLIEARTMLSRLEARDLRKLIGAPRGRGGRRNEFGDPREDVELADFVGRFPISSSPSWEIRLIAILRLVYETAHARDVIEVNTRADPSRWSLLASYCLERLGSLAANTDERERETEALIRFQLWRYGRNARADKPGFVFHGELDTMNLDELQHHLRTCDVRRPDERCKKLIQRALDSTLPAVLEQWCGQLDEVLAPSGATTPG